MYTNIKTIATAVLGLTSIVAAAPHKLPTLSKRQATGALTDVDILQLFVPPTLLSLL